MFKNMRLVILFDMFVNRIFKMVTKFANVARNRARNTTFFFKKFFLIFWEGYIQKPGILSNGGIFRTQGIFRTLPNIYDEAFCENSYLDHF